MGWHMGTNLEGELDGQYLRVVVWNVGLEWAELVRKKYGSRVGCWSCGRDVFCAAGRDLCAVHQFLANAMETRQ